MFMNRPYFIWDYDISENRIREILLSGNETERLWLVGRILSHARYEDVWKYLKVKDIVDLFPKLRM